MSTNTFITNTFNEYKEKPYAICLYVCLYKCSMVFQMVCMVMLMVATGILGCTAAGFFKCAQLISQQFSYIVTGAFSFILPGTMLLVPFLVGGLAPENQPLQWRWVFIVTAGVLVRAARR